MNTEQERADFEAWAQDKTELYKMSNGEYSSRITRFAFEAYQAGRAALQSQDREALLNEISATLPGVYYMGLPDGGDVSIIEQLRRMAEDAARYRWLRHGDNDELVLCNGPVDKNYWYLPRNERLDEAIDHARRIEGEGK